MSDNKWMKEALDRIESKVDKIDEKQDNQTAELNNIKVIQAEQAVVLEHHVKRTDLAEKHIELLTEKLANDTQSLQKQLNPIHKERAMVKGAGKLIMALIACGGALFSFLKFVMGLI